MKRVKAACILQTLVFSQKPDCGLNPEQIRQANCQEVERYRQYLNRNRIRYRIDGELEREDGAIELKIRKQYNDKADVEAYFE